jgi:hypothetical protein
MSETKVMKCPKCSKDMESGYLDVRHGVGIGELYFTKDEPSFWRAKGDLLMDGLGKITAIAHRCSSCKLVVFEYYGKIE